MVAGKVIISDIEESLYQVNKTSNPNQIDLLSIIINKINQNKENNQTITNQNDNTINTSNNQQQIMTVNAPFLKFLTHLEYICKFGSLFILSVFIAEIILKLLFDPKSFRKILEILDAIVIIVSFGLNTLLLVKNVQVTGLLTLLRLW